MLSKISLMLPLWSIVFVFMIFKVQFPAMGRYVYVLRPKVDNLTDVFGKEAKN